MAKTPPFFRHVAHVTGLLSPAPALERFPYHDEEACSVGQAIKASGEWQYYDPAQEEETRDRCAECAALSSSNSE